MPLLGVCKRRSTARTYLDLQNPKNGPSPKAVAISSTAQGPFRTPPIPSNGDHKARTRGPLGGSRYGPLLCVLWMSRCILLFCLALCTSANRLLVSVRGRMRKVRERANGRRPIRCRGITAILDPVPHPRNYYRIRLTRTRKPVRQQDSRPQ